LRELPSPNLLGGPLLLPVVGIRVLAPILLLKSDNRNTNTIVPLLDGDVCPVALRARGCERAGASRTTARLRILLRVCRRLGFLGGGTMRFLLSMSSVDIFFPNSCMPLFSSSVAWESAL
jgi:hypothetical protein